MEFSIFVWLTASIFFIFSGTLSLLAQGYLKKERKNNLCYLWGIVILSILLILYLPNSMQLWITLNEIVYPYIKYHTGNYTYILEEVWYTIAFFRNIWLVFLVALSAIAIESSSYPISSRYRMMNQFNHNKLLIMIGSLFLYFFTKNIATDSWIPSYFLCIALYSAVYYWKFGYSTIIYILKRSNIPYEISIILLVGSVIVTKEYFILPLTACIGFGISDIWMDYHYRNASSMVFTTNFIK